MLLFPVIFFSQDSCESITFAFLQHYPAFRDEILILSSTNYFPQLLFFDKLIKGNINRMSHCSSILVMENHFYHFFYVPYRPGRIEI